MTSIIITLLFVFYKIPLINLLGDKGMGYYSIAFVIYLLIMTCMTYGMPKALYRMLVEYRAKGQYALLNHTIKTAMFYAVISGVVLTLVLFLEADVIATHILKASYSSFAIRGMSLCIIPASIAGVIHGVFTGTKLTAISKKAQKLEKLLISVLTLVGSYFFIQIGSTAASNKSEPALTSAYSSMGAALGLTVGILGAVIFLFIYYKDYKKKLERFLKKDSKKTAFSKTDTYKQLLLCMLPFILTILIFHTSSLMDYAVFNRIMSIQGHKENNYILLLGMLNGKYEFFISIPILILNWYMSIKSSEYKKAVEDRNKRKFLNSISQTIRLVMLFVIPCTALYIIFSTPLCNLLFTGTNDTPSVLLKTGAISIIFYTLAVISNTVLNVLDDWASIAKNAFVSLIVQLAALLLMMIIFEWGMIAVILSRIIFSISLCILNEHTLRERTGYVQEYKKVFYVPVIASVIMSCIGFVIYYLFKLFIADKFACLIAILFVLPVYIMALVSLGGITQREMYQIPGGKYLSLLCRKLHLIK